MKKTAANDSRGPQGGGRMMSTAAVGRSNCGARVISKDSEDHGIGRRLDRGAHKFMTVRVSANNCSMTYGEETEDHDIGRRLDRGGRAHEFTTKRLDLGLDRSLVLKKGALGYATAITTL